MENQIKQLETEFEEGLLSEHQLAYEIIQVKKAHGVGLDGDDTAFLQCIPNKILADCKAAHAARG